MPRFDTEKFQREEKVRISALRNRGDVNAIVRDTGLPLAYVIKVVDKWKKRRKYSAVDFLIAETMAMHILEGYEQRTRYLVDCMRALEHREQALISLCCQSPVVLIENTTDRFRCLKCDKEASTELVDKDFVYKMKLKIVDSMRAEDKALATSAKQLGFTAQEVPIVLQQFFNGMRLPKQAGNQPQTVSQATNAASPMDMQNVIDVDLQKQLINMAPHEREKMIRNLESRICEEGGVHEQSNNKRSDGAVGGEPDSVEESDT
jgi:hypothetical protein